MTAPIRQSDFIGKLCVALAHRWEPERLFVIFTAYFDEAATHGAKPHMTMAALLGNAYEWRRCELRLGRLQKQYGFTIFHAKDFKARKGEFKGWPQGTYSNLINDLTELVRDTLSEGVAISLPRELYLSEYRAPPIPKGMTLDSQFGACFRGCLSHLADVLLTGRNSGKRHTLHLIIEDGHSNVGDTQRIFNDVKASLEERGHFLLGTITIAKKEEAPPLMLSDFLAHTHYLMDIAAKSAGGVHYRDIVEDVPVLPREAGLTFMQFQPGALSGMKARWAAEKQRKIDAWRVARDARKAASS